MTLDVRHIQPKAKSNQIKEGGFKSLKKRYSRPCIAAVPAVTGVCAGRPKPECLWEGGDEGRSVEKGRESERQGVFKRRAKALRGSVAKALSWPERATHTRTFPPLYIYIPFWNKKKNRFLFISFRFVVNHIIKNLKKKIYIYLNSKLFWLVTLLGVCVCECVCLCVNFVVVQPFPSPFIRRHYGPV